MLAGAAVVGLGLARFVTRPLQRLEEAAAAVGEGHLDARAPERDGPPEVRSLAAVFNETVGEARAAAALAGASSSPTPRTSCARR